MGWIRDRKKLSITFTNLFKNNLKCFKISLHLQNTFNYTFLEKLRNKNRKIHLKSGCSDEFHKLQTIITGLHVFVEAWNFHSFIGQSMNKMFLFINYRTLRQYRKLKSITV